MRSKALELKVLPLILLAVAISLPIQAAVLFGHSWGEASAIMQKLTWLNWLVMGLCLTSAVVLGMAHRAALYLVPLTLSIVILNNFVVGFHNTHFDLLTTSGASLGFALLFAPLLRVPVREVLLNPSKQWWRSSERRKTHIQATLDPLLGQSLSAFTFDLSETGAFIRAPESADFDLLSEGQMMRLKLSINSLVPLSCEAVVVRTSPPVGSYPAGYGIRFIDLDSSQKRQLRQFLEV